LDRAIIDADGTIAPTDAQCKQGIDLSYDGQWGYHPLVIWLANIKEPLYLVNRSGNRPSHQGAAEHARCPGRRRRPCSIPARLNSRREGIRLFKG
jgi:hypothetical protein